MPKGPLSVLGRLGHLGLCGQILFTSPINTFKVSMHAGIKAERSGAIRARTEAFLAQLPFRKSAFTSLQLNLNSI
jgi:hypothetical protein